MNVATTLSPLTFDVVNLSPADIPVVYELYRRALAAVPDPAAVRADEPSFFEDMFAVGGEILGLRCDGDLVAYGVLRPELAREHDRVGLDGLVAPDAVMRVLDGSAVRPDFWAHGLQRTIIDARIVRAGEEGASSVIAKAAPRNVPSMRNLTKRGFRIVGRVMKPYGWRYIHHRPVADEPVHPEDGTWTVSEDVDGSEARFEDGFYACSAQRDPHGVPLLRFAPERLPRTAPRADTAH
ncbi:GNAT family N-acetyltransferase [Acuticoccus kandeliae]|uniref:GNAT family N-acetyltransferase n=1 Tax=Acuticoccus kandeliae TaxID=2073160 RepID=UPI000D3E50A5|nr:GNAT family N-acetyltransferase [Acuticoccus kandeliae]